MPKFRSSLRTASALAVALPAIAFATPAAAQDELPPLPETVEIETTEVRTVPPVPVAPTTRPLAWNEEVEVGPDGVETIIRTRRIDRSGPWPHPRPHHGMGHGLAFYPSGPIGHAPIVLEREQWLAECRRRTEGRSEKEKGGIIGGLLGAVAGGIIGNRVADGERLAGTLIGAGTGGLAGLLLGNLIGGGKKDGRYDCEAALDGYLAYYRDGAARAIPGGHLGMPYYPGYAPVYSGHYGYSAGCGCQQPLIAWIPIRTEVRQRVIVRERITEEIIPGRRVIPPRKPSKLIKVQPAPAPAPRPVKMIKN